MNVLSCDQGNGPGSFLIGFIAVVAGHPDFVQAYTIGFKLYVQLIFLSACFNSLGLVSGKYCYKFITGMNGFYFKKALCIRFCKL
ncbi:hypothetical protein D3C87_1296910 [compost metagenome]